MDVCSPNSLKIDSSVTAGLNFHASAELWDYPSPTWAATLILRGAGVIDVTGVGSEHSFSFDVAASVSASWSVGTYWYELRVTDGTNVIKVASGSINITPDLAAITGTYDGRSANQIALDSINAVLAKNATHDQQRYIINNRELWRRSVADLIKLQAFYQNKVNAEKLKAAGGGKFGRKIPVIFSGC